MEEISAIEDDGLISPEIGSWGEEKYRHVALYSSLFAKSMRRKWECLVYIDLFSGAGRARIRGTNRIVNSSPLLVLGLPDKFDRYIFCEKERKKYEALKKRIKREFPDADSHYVEGDANQRFDEILAKMPDFRKSFRVLAFCFADPYALSNLKFETIRQLSARYMDFLVLIPSGMEANRFVTKYTKVLNSPVDLFLGSSEWRAAWREAQKNKTPFEQFIVKEFGKSMESLGYIDSGLDLAVPIRSDDRNLLLYRLALYSRHELGKEFWKQAKKYSKAQTELF
ncbi:MAG: three-Cys-motif partner protein TcmP [Nitrospirae bacterium]|nr:three-Cys-motif partner protein TcmP [Nitrospirota bacterium]MCL5422033.1 three-Cys-motif partner protein TcmP [Nitrospirota bacterium]